MQNPKSRNNRSDSLMNELTKFRQMKCRLMSAEPNSNFNADYYPQKADNLSQDEFPLTTVKSLKISPVRPKFPISLTTYSNHEDTIEQTANSDPAFTRFESSTVLSKSILSCTSQGSNNFTSQPYNPLRERSQNVRGTPISTKAKVEEKSKNEPQLGKPNSLGQKTPESTSLRVKTEGSVKLNYTPLNRSGKTFPTENQTPTRKGQHDPTSNEKKTKNPFHSKHNSELKKAFSPSTTKAIIFSGERENQNLELRKESLPIHHRRSFSLVTGKITSSVAENPSNNGNWNFDKEEEGIPPQTIDDLQFEIEKWKVFGKVITDSYEQLNLRFNNFLRETENASNDDPESSSQVAKLRALLDLREQENSYLKMQLQEIQRYGKYPSYQCEEIEKLKKQNDLLRIENISLRRSSKETASTNPDFESYKNFAEQKVKECSALAEEIICLRTDLDRSHTALLQLQRGLEYRQTVEKNGSLSNQNTLSQKSLVNLSREPFDKASRHDENSSPRDDNANNTMKSIVLIRNDSKDKFGRFSPYNHHNTPEEPLARRLFLKE